MATFRVNKNKNYTVMSNYHLRDRDLSLKAKGLLSLMLSLPENWDYSIAGLVVLSKDGKESVMTALNELEKNRYLIREPEQGEKGRFNGYIYNIYEEPHELEVKERKRKNPNTEKPFTEKPFTEKPFTENPNTENPTQINTKENNNENNKVLNNKRKKERKEESYEDIIDNHFQNEEVKDMLREFIKMRKLIKSPLTNLALSRICNKLKNLSENPNEQISILEQSIINNWKDIYPLKDNKQKNKQENKKEEISYSAIIRERMKKPVELNLTKEELENLPF